VSTAEEPLFARVREAAAEVARRARHVRIENEEVEELAGLLARERPAQPSLDPAQRGFADEATTVAYVITLNAINFGSGWFPHLAKRDGLSGYLTIAGALRERFEREGAWSAAELEGLRAEDCARLFGQKHEPPVSELMALFAQALNELGAFLAREHRGRFAGPVEEARGSAEQLVRSLARMPLYRDVARYEGFEVPFYKRAQITCSDLAEALRGRGLGQLRDVDELTLFADNLRELLLAPPLGENQDANVFLARFDTRSKSQNHRLAEQLVAQFVEAQEFELHICCGPRSVATRYATHAAPTLRSKR
jgi:hypothetical protein